jgi:hypothetical protein
MAGWIYCRSVTVWVQDVSPFEEGDDCGRSLTSLSKHFMMTEVI